MGLRQILASRLVGNFLYLYAVQGANYLFPLLTLPYLSRAFGPEGFGLLALGQALALNLQLIGEFGFSLFGTREVAQRRQDPRNLASIASGILGVRLLLALLLFLLTLVVYLWHPLLRGHPLLTLGAFFYGVASAFSPTWFFRGMERMKEVALLEVAPRTLALLGIFTLVRTEEHAHLPLWINGLALGLANLWGTFQVHREVGWQTPRLGETKWMLAKGSRLLAFQLVMAFYLSVNPWVLSLLLSPKEVGLYAGADRLVRASWGMLEPLARGFFPRISSLVAQDYEEARKVASRAILLLLAVGAALALFLGVAAPLLIKLVLGGAYTEAASALMVLALMLPLGALAHGLGVQWALAIGMDSLLNKAVVLAALVQLGVVFPLVHFMGIVGAAWGSVLASLVEALILLITLSKMDKLPLGRLSLGRGGGNVP